MKLGWSILWYSMGASFVFIVFPKLIKKHQEHMKHQQGLEESFEKARDSKKIDC